MLANVTAALMSMMIGAAAPSNSVANMAGSLAIMLFLLFGGFLLNKDQVPWYCAWIASASFFNYAYEALAVSTQPQALYPAMYHSLGPGAKLYCSCYLRIYTEPGRHQQGIKVYSKKVIHF